MSNSFVRIMNYKKQKQPFRGVIGKRCSENMHQIYRGTPMPKGTSEHLWMAASEEKIEKVYLIKINIDWCIVNIISLNSALCVTRNAQFSY